MKSLTKFLIAVSAFTALSCSEADFWERPENVRVVAHTENIASGSLLWSEGDSLAVVDESGAGFLFAIEAAGNTYGTFYTYKWAAETPAYAVYPADKTVTHEGGLCTSLPSEYELTAMKHCDAFAAVGRLEGSRNIYKALPMKNIMGLLKISVAEANVTSLKVEAVAGESLAGQVIVDVEKLYNNETAFWTLVDGSMTSSVTVTPKVGSAVEKSGCFKPGEYYISLLPQTYESGLKITMTYADGKTEVIQRNARIVVERNALFDIDDILPENITLELPFLNESNVNPLGQFVAWANQSADGDTYAYSYEYDYNGQPMTLDLGFTIYAGNKYSYEAKVAGLAQKVLYVSTGGKWVIKLPAIKGRYLKSVSFTHTGVTEERRFRLQEGYPTPGHYFSAVATPEDVTSEATATISIPTGATDTAQISDTKIGTSYCVQLNTNKEYYITAISVTYTREKPVNE